MELGVADQVLDRAELLPVLVHAHPNPSGSSLSAATRKSSSSLEQLELALLAGLPALRPGTRGPE
jgi:hypothetical protein